MRTIQNVYHLKLQDSIKNGIDNITDRTEDVLEYVTNEKFSELKIKTRRI